MEWWFRLCTEHIALDKVFNACHFHTWSIIQSRPFYAYTRADRSANVIIFLLFFGQCLNVYSEYNFVSFMQFVQKNEAPPPPEKHWWNFKTREFWWKNLKKYWRLFVLSIRWDERTMCENAMWKWFDPSTLTSINLQYPNKIHKTRK